MNDHSTPPVDESWVAHLRDLGSGVAPPTAADPHTMSRVAIRRTRTRRAVLATGGGVMTVAAVAGAAFALGSPTTAGGLLPGGPPSAVSSADAAALLEEERAEELQAAAREALAAGGPPTGWEVQDVEDLRYALPPEMETSGPVQDEPGVTSDMWHSRDDPDAPPFLRIAHYAEGSDNPAWPDAASRPDGEQLDLPGVGDAVALDVTDEAAGFTDGTAGTAGPDSPTAATMLVLEPSVGPGAYVITLNLPRESAEDFLHAFEATLMLP